MPAIYSDSVIHSILQILRDSEHIFLTQTYFGIPEVFKTKVSKCFLSIKSPFEFVFSNCEFTKVIL